MLNQPGLRAVNLQKVRLLDRVANKNPKLANEIRALKLDWFTIKNQADEASPAAEVFIYDEIGGSFGVGATDFIDQLNEITADEIVVRINSPGGLLIDAIAISSALAQHPATITTRIDGIAASAASVIAVAGDYCEMMVGSQMMIHDVIANSMGNAADYREMATWLDEQSANVANIYANKAGNGTPEEWRARMKAETWMFAAEAIELGLADSVYERVKAAPPMPMPDMPPDEESPEEDDTEDSVSDEALDKAIDALMNRKHRLTNRGYRYTGRNAAPKPKIEEKDFSDLLEAWR